MAEEKLESPCGLVERLSLLLTSQDTMVTLTSSIHTQHTRTVCLTIICARPSHETSYSQHRQGKREAHNTHRERGRELARPKHLFWPLYFLCFEALSFIFSTSFGRTRLELFHGKTKYYLGTACNVRGY